MGRAECEAQLRKMRHLLGLPARRLEEDRRPDSPVDVPQRPLGIRVERPGVRLLASNVRVDRRDEARLAKLTEYDTPKSKLFEWCRSEALLRKSKLAPSAPTRRFVTDRSRTTLVDQARSFD